VLRRREVILVVVVVVVIVIHLQMRTPARQTQATPGRATGRTTAPR
jgi:hypothetical protein